ncbi:MAG TPA: hypothetical protein PKO09_10945 [Anaerolineae bacterium]|nr:hypothetical protein [Anaerolineae bacterium]
MRLGHLGFVACLILSCLLLAACGQWSTPTTGPAEVSPSPEPPVTSAPPAVSPSPLPPSPSPTAPSSTPTPTRVRPTATVTTPPQQAVLTPFPKGSCRLGTGLRDETGSLLEKYKASPGLVMAATVENAQAYFPQLEGWIRVIGAPSLNALAQKAARAQESGLAYEALAYGLETGKSTPDEEWQDLIGSTVKARALADQYGKLLVMGPGFKLMSANEDKYAGMSALADIWVFQTQQLQKNPPGETYREGVERVVGLIRGGNPDIPIWTQITLPPDREPNAKEWLAYRGQIQDLVTGTYVGAYTWRTVDSQTLVSTIDAIFAGACGNE